MQQVWPRTFHNRYCSLPVYIWILAEGMYGGKKSSACFKGHGLKSSDSSEKSDNRHVNVSTWNLIKRKLQYFSCSTCTIRTCLHTVHKPELCILGLYRLIVFISF